MNREDRGNICPGAQIEHLPERKAAHVAVQEIKRKNKNAEDHVIVDSMHTQRRNQSCEHCGDKDQFRKQRKIFRANRLYIAVWWIDIQQEGLSSPIIGF